MAIVTRSNPRGLIALLASVWALLAPARSFAEDAPRSSLVVTRGDGTETCPDSSALAEQVRRLTGADVIDTTGLATGPRSTYVQVAVSRNFSGFHAEITAGGQHHGTRSLDDLGPTCAALADAIAVTIAIVLDPYAAEPPPSAPARESDAVERAGLTSGRVSSLTPDATRTHPASLAASAPPRPHLFVELDAGAAFGALSDTVPLIGLRVGVRASSRWSAAIGGAFAFPATLSDRDRTIDLGLSYGYVVLCGRALGDSDGTRLDWCFEPMLGVISGTGHGYDQDSTEHALWAAGAAGPELVFPIVGRFAWTASALGVIPFVRQSFDITRGGADYRLFRSSATAGMLAFGVRGEL